MDERKKVLIVGTGSWMYGDEAAGIMIAHHIHQRLGHAVSVACGAERLQKLWNSQERCPWDLVILIATTQESEKFVAGSWCQIDMTKEPESGYELLRSSRSTQAPSLIEITQKPHSADARFRLYAMAGRNLQLGAPLSSAVQSAIAPLEEQIVRDIHRELGLSLQRETALAV